MKYGYKDIVMINIKDIKSQYLKRQMEDLITFVGYNRFAIEDVVVSDSIEYRLSFFKENQLGQKDFCSDVFGNGYIWVEEPFLTYLYSPSL